MKIRSTLLGTTALVVLLTAGAAQSLSGSNTVFTDDIAPKQVYNSDLADNAVSGGKVYDNSLSGADIRNGTLSGADIADNSLSGADIDESTLDLQSAFARSGEFTCEVPDAGGDEKCGQITVTMPTAGVILHQVTDLGDSNWDIEADQAQVDGVRRDDYVFVGAGEHTVEAYGDCSGPGCDPEISVRIEVVAFPAG